MRNKFLAENIASSGVKVDQDAVIAAMAARDFEKAQSLIPDDVVERENALPAAIRLPARAGECILIHNYCWHRSGRNATGKTRRALTVCLMDSATRCTRRRSPRQFLPMFR